MRHIITNANLIWFGLVIVLAAAWHADHRELTEQVDTYEREVISCHEKLDRLRIQIEQQESPQHAQSPRQPNPES